MKEDHRSYRRNFCSCEKKAWKKIQACKISLASFCDSFSISSQIPLGDLRPKIADAIRAFHDKTCLKFREVDQTYGGDYVKMHKGNGWVEMKW